MASPRLINRPDGIPEWVPQRLWEFLPAVDESTGWPTDVVLLDHRDAADLTSIKTLSVLRSYPPKAADLMLDLAICFLEWKAKKPLLWDAFSTAAASKPGLAVQAWNEALAVVGYM